MDPVLRCIAKHPKLQQSVFSGMSHRFQCPYLRAVVEQFAHVDFNNFINRFLLDKFSEKSDYFIFVHELMVRFNETGTGSR